MRKKKAKKQSFIPIILGEEGDLPREIMVLPIGEWETIKYGVVQVTLDHIKEMIANFYGGVRVGVPIDVDHDAGKAAGWIKDLINKDDAALWARVEWTPYGEELLRGRLYRFFSPEFSLDFIDPETQERHGAVFIAGTLTNRPLFKEIKPIVSHELTKNDNSFTIRGSMDIQTILSKPVAEITDEEKAFLQDHKDELTEEQRKMLFGEEQKEEPQTETTETTEEQERVEEEQKQEEQKQEETHAEEQTQTVQASEQETVTIQASELETIKKMAEEGQRAKAELLRFKTEQEVEKTLLFHEDGGKIAPKAKDALVSLLLSFNEEQRRLFNEVMDAVPEKKLFTEHGSSDVLTIHKEFATLIASEKEEAKKEGRVLSDAEAIKIAARKYPEVYKEYEEELKKGK